MGKAIFNGLKKNVDFSGRATRSEFWYFYLFYTITFFAIALIDSLINSLLVHLLMSLVYFAFLVPLTAVSIRRMHDIGKSGWFTLVPLYNIVLYCTPTLDRALPTNIVLGSEPSNPPLSKTIEGAERPGRRMTIVISILFGPFGAIPANNAAKQARERNYPSQPYWTAFWVSWVASSAAVVVVSIAVTLAFIGIILHGSGNTSTVSSPQSINSTDTTPALRQLPGTEGLSTDKLSEQDLRKVVEANHLTAYWVGPEAGHGYALHVFGRGEIEVVYLPGTPPPYQFRTVKVYAPNAYGLTQSDGSLSGHVGITTQNGFTGAYKKSTPNDVYVRVKGSNLQVEVHDPDATQALTLAQNSLTLLQ